MCLQGISLIRKKWSAGNEGMETQALSGLGQHFGPEYSGLTGRFKELNSIFPSFFILEDQKNSNSYSS